MEGEVSSQRSVYSHVDELCSAVKRNANDGSRAVNIEAKDKYQKYKVKNDNKRPGAFTLHERTEVSSWLTLRRNPTSRFRMTNTTARKSEVAELKRCTRQRRCRCREQVGCCPGTESTRWPKMSRWRREQVGSRLMNDKRRGRWKFGSPLGEWSFEV